MRFHVKHYVGALAVLVLAMPIWAAKNSSRTDWTRFDVYQPTMVGQTQLKPGHYRFEAKESADQLDVLRDGKVIATVPCKWIKLPKKAHDSEVVSNKNQVVQLEFHGRPEAVEVR